MVGLACLLITAWYWFVPHRALPNSPRFATGYLWLIMGATIMFVFSQIELCWQRRAARS